MSDTIKIERLAFGGDGVGYLPSGKIVFVPGAFPGDEVSVDVIDEQRSFARARLSALLTPSPHRAPAACAHADVCGGCQFQKLTPAAEWELKTSAVLDTLTRVGGLTIPDAVETIGPGDPSHYRRRVRFQVDEAGRTGFFAPDSNTLVEPEDCPVTHTALLRARDVLHGKLGGLGGGTLLLELSGEDRAVGFLETASADLDAATARVRAALAEARAAEGDSPLVGVRIAQAGRSAWKDFRDVGEVMVTVTVAGVERTVPVGLFFQANAAMNDALVRTVIERLEPAPGDDILELFSGWGNFSLPLLRAGASVQGMELSVASVNAADYLTRNDPHVDTEAARFNVRNLHTGLPTKHKRKGRYDKVLLDPPRSGAKAVLDDLLELAPGRIVYVSCDAATLARDLKTLTGSGYALTHLTLIDMFPRTYHVEVVATLFG